MSKIKNFFIKLKAKIAKINKKIKSSISNFTSKIDVKIKPNVGYFWYRFFTFLSRILFMLIFPIFIILVGVNSYNVILNDDAEMYTVAIIVCGVFWIVLQFFAIFMKKYFAKWRNYSIIKINSKQEKKLEKKSEKKQKKIEKQKSKEIN
ncbi:MAG: hypothetical protein HPPSJP_3930 [Candidatus Hepatoplasma scabrum]|nr:MAG: hypothetical protein HPPSJP_3930 [Candidatus Hepatoplasma sp.]